jgi:hypothetical protein
MESHRIRQTPQEPAQTPTGGEAPPDLGGSSLARRSRAYADVARRASEQCQHGHAAEQELKKRVNRSGQ